MITPPDQNDHPIIDHSSEITDQQSTESSSPNPLLTAEDGETASQNGGDEAGDETALDDRIDAYSESYELLISQGIHQKTALNLANEVEASLIQAWIDTKPTALRAKCDGGLGVRTWPGFLIRVLEAKQPPLDQGNDPNDPERFIKGPYANEIHH